MNQHGPLGNIHNQNWCGDILLFWSFYVHWLNNSISYTQLCSWAQAFHKSIQNFQSKTNSCSFFFTWGSLSSYNSDYLIMINQNLAALPSQICTIWTVILWTIKIWLLLHQDGVLVIQMEKQFLSRSFS